MTDETDVYICGICKKEFQDFVTFLQHKSSFGVFKCKLCNTSYHDREDIQEHINLSHSNQKVDVVFTIPTKASIVSTRADQTEESKEPPKTGASLSVYTCRLCNRFTLVERTMLLHLQNVHKIHVTPGSVELAALMLCSKPLDAASVPRLTGAPVVVKTVTAPVISKPVVVNRAVATQTKLSSLNISSVATMTEQEQGLEWVELAEESSYAIPENKDTNIQHAEVTPSIENPIEGGSDGSLTLENQNNEVQNVKMTSILKSKMATLVKSEIIAETEKGSDVITEPVQLLDVEQVVCIDGGHDYVSNVELKKEPEQLEVVQFKDEVEVESKIDNVSTIMELGSSMVDDEEEEEEILLIPSPKKYVGKKSATGSQRAEVVQNTSSKKIVQSEQKRPVVKNVSRSLQTSAKRKPVAKSDDEDDDEPEPEPEDEEPQPGADGMYHCRQCNRAFARERQFKAHMNVHVMYGEHYLESPGGGSRYESKSGVVQRKKSKYDMLND